MRGALISGGLALLLMTSATAQSRAAVQRGTWTASVGARQVLQGTWTAELQPNAPNTATGSWALISAANQIVVEGTWSAVKASRSWSGTWSARILPPQQSQVPSGAGRVMSGSWRADLDAASPQTLGEMLQRTLQSEVAGAWRSGALQGRWSLKGSS